MILIRHWSEPKRPVYLDQSCKAGLKCYKTIATFFLMSNVNLHHNWPYHAPKWLLVGITQAVNSTNDWRHFLITHITHAYLAMFSKDSHFKLSVTSSNLGRFLKFLHCWKTYEICYKNRMTLPTSPKACCYTTLENLKFEFSADIQQICKKMQTSCIFVTFNFVTDAQILIFSVFNIASFPCTDCCLLYTSDAADE